MKVFQKTLATRRQSYLEMDGNNFNKKINRFTKYAQQKKAASQQYLANENYEFAKLLGSSLLGYRVWKLKLINRG